MSELGRHPSCNTIFVKVQRSSDQNYSVLTLHSTLVTNTTQHATSQSASQAGSRLHNSSIYRCRTLSSLMSISSVLLNGCRVGLSAVQKLAGEAVLSPTQRYVQNLHTVVSITKWFCQPAPASAYLARNRAHARHQSLWAEDPCCTCAKHHSPHCFQGG